MKKTDLVVLAVIASLIIIGALEIATYTIRHIRAIPGNIRTNANPYKVYSHVIVCVPLGNTRVLPEAVIACKHGLDHDEMGYWSHGKTDHPLSFCFGDTVTISHRTNTNVATSTNAELAKIILWNPNVGGKSETFAITLPSSTGYSGASAILQNPHTNILGTGKLSSGIRYTEYFRPLSN